jgi:hypothetical protein
VFVVMASWHRVLGCEHVRVCWVDR